MSNFDKGRQYYTSVRHELFDLVDDLKGSILDVGCGDGASLMYLKESGARRVAGIEIHPAQAEAGRLKGLEIHELNVEKDTLPFQENEFDVVILGDVLEHLYDPWLTLKKIRALLKPGGTVLISVPNVKHYHVLADLLFRDRWRYAEAGILDVTHVRFFTLSEAKALVLDAGLLIDRIECKLLCSDNKKRLNSLLGGRLNTFLTYQYLMVAKKA
jgi:O-antigen biosynthesis protein